MIIENKPFLKECHSPGSCEMCGKACREREPHHAVITRGASGSDTWINIVLLGHTQSHQCQCHFRVDCKEGRDECLRIIAKRHKCSVDDIEAANVFIKNRLDKHDPEAKLADKIVTAVGNGTLTTVAAQLVETALMQAGKIK